MTKLTEAEQIDIIMRSVARGTNTPERGATAIKRIVAARLAPIEALADAWVGCESIGPMGDAMRFAGDGLAAALASTPQPDTEEAGK